MYDSKVSDFNVVKATGRDILRELSDACKKYDMTMGIYYSQAQDWDDDNAYKKDYEDKNEWKPEFRTYFDEKCKPQLKELLENYDNISLIWFDTPMGMTADEAQELRDWVKGIKPDCIISGRIGHQKGDYMTTGDNFIPRLPYDGDWEVPATVNDTWGYNKYDTNWKNPDDILNLLLKIVGRGGNYLLNVGPMADGTVPEACVEVMNEVGKYVTENAEAIYGTTNVGIYPYEIPSIEFTKRPHVVLTAKHHDGFCLFDSKYTDYKVTNTPAGRDLIKEYVEALREEGLKVGIYFTLLDWHHPDYPHYGDRIHPMRNHKECGNENRDFSRYTEYLYNQVEEICTNYGQIDIIWFDFSYDDMRGEKWGATKLINMVRSLQPQVIIDNRLEASGEGRGSLYECDPTPYHGDFVSPEQIIPPEGICDKEGNPMVWEACFTMNNNWGYCANDHYYKPASMLIKKLVECVSKGGNMILNVGPDAKGKFPKESSAILAEIGRWMDKNHDSIYGCVPAENIPKPDYGRITRNGNKYYVHIYENTLGPLPLLGFDKDKIVKVRALDDGHEVPISNAWMHSDYPDIAFVDLGPDPVLPDPVDYVLEVEMAE